MTPQDATLPGQNGPSPEGAHGGSALDAKPVLYHLMPLKQLWGGVLQSGSVLFHQKISVKLLGGQGTSKGFYSRVGDGPFPKLSIW